MRSPAVLALTAALAVSTCVVAASAHCHAQEKPAPAGDGPSPKESERSYDVSGVVTPVPRFVGAHGPWSVRPFGWIDPGRDALESEEDEPRPNVDQIAEVFRSVLPRPDAENASADAIGHRVLVRTTAEGHRRIEQALGALRASVGTPWELDVRALTIPAGAAGDALLDEVARAGGASVSADLAARLLAADRDRGRRGGTVFAAEGQWTGVERVRARTVAADWGVEIAEGSSIAHPRVAEVADGFRAAVRVGRMHDGRALLSLTAAAGDLVDPVRRADIRTTDIGSAEMPEVRGAWFSTMTALRAGETAAFVAASAISAADAVRRVVLVKVAGAPAALTLPGLAVLPVGAIACERSNVHLAAPDGEPVGAEEFRWGPTLRVFEGEPGVDVDTVKQSVVRDAGASAEREGAVVAGVSTWPGGGALFVQGDEQFRESAKATVARLERETLQPVRLTVRLVARDDAGAEQPAGTIVLPASAGRTVAAAAYTSVPYVGAADVEVAQHARIADPHTTCAVGGVVLNARIAPGPGTGWRADLDLRVVSVGAVEAIPVSAAEVGLLERVPQRRARAAMAVVLEPGKPREIDLGENPFGVGRLVAVVRAE